VEQGEQLQRREDDLRVSSLVIKLGCVVAAAVAMCLATAAGTGTSGGVAGGAATRPALHVLRCPKDPVEFTPLIDDAVRAVRRLRVLGRTVVAQGRIKLTPANTPILTAYSIHLTGTPESARWKKLITARCGGRAVISSWYFELDFPTLIAGSGTTSYIVTRARRGWMVLAQSG
jgi:hypothetical protein